MDNVHILTYANTQPVFNHPIDTADFCRPEQTINVYQLTHELQQTLDLATLLDTFTQYVQPHLNFHGLQLHSNLGVSEISNNQTHGMSTEFELHLGEEPIGKLIYFSTSPFTQSMKQRLSQWHSILLYPLRNALAYNRVLRLATRDPLTGLSNRSEFNVNVQKKLEGCRRQDKPFGLMLLDLDNFKQVNDQFGHHLGDQTLQEFAAILNQCVRATDSVFRFGGDEFAVLVDDSELSTNVLIAQRVQSSVQASDIMRQHGVTASMGFAVATKSDTTMSLFERADKALYQAKSSGRNTYCSEENQACLA